MKSLRCDIHVLPVGDAIEHTDTRQCWCRPHVDDFGDRAVVTHNSADGREYFEDDRKPTPEQVH